jgi:hypothetical protein
LPVSRRSIVRAAGAGLLSVPLASPAKEGSTYVIGVGGVEAPPVAELNQAEQKLAAILAKSVRQKEKLVGFEFGPEEVAEIEKILRNKYCGKSGLFGSMEGGTCRENEISGAFCSSDERFSSSAGCDGVAPRKAMPSVVEGLLKSF